VNARWKRSLFGVALVFVFGAGLYWWLRNDVKPTETRVSAVATQPSRTKVAEQPAVLAEVKIALPMTVAPAATAPNPQLTPGRPISSKQRNDMLTENAYALSRLKLDGLRMEKLKNLLIERSQVQKDARDAHQRLGGAPQDGPAAENQAAQRVDEEIRELLGDESFEEFIVLSREGGSRKVIERDFTPVLLDAGVPLTNDQLDQLAAAYADVVYRDPAGRTKEARSVELSIGMRPIDDRLLRRAEAFLSPAQIAAYRQGLLQQHARAVAILRGK